ncbi:MAG: F0F1 ATP synthase subunit A [Acidobacteria bacterium]|nr:F0F1 ATP synthase subunit A [Acidobacteriota bacterium]
MEHEVSALYNWLYHSFDEMFGVGFITDQAVMAWFVVLASLVIFPILSRRFSVYEPGAAQQMLEFGVGAINTMCDAFIGENARKYAKVMGPIAFFIVAANLITFIPGFQPPTGDLNTTVALGVTSFLIYNFVGIRAQGLTYLKQFTGDMPMMVPLMLPIEILSHLSRPTSLAIRLFGNIFAEHTITGVFFMLVPIGLPVVFGPLGVFVSFMQTFVFVMLSMIYIAGALEHGH